MTDSELDTLLGLAAKTPVSPSASRMNAIYDDIDQIAQSRVAALPAERTPTWRPKSFFKAMSAGLACATCGLFMGYSAVASDLFVEDQLYATQSNLAAFGSDSYELLEEVSE